MKKIVLVITALMLFVATGCSSLVVEEAVVEVTAEEVVNKIETKETFAFILGSKSCPACTQYRDNLKELQSKEGVTLDYVNLDEVDNMEVVGDLITNHLDGSIDEGISTPTTYFIVDGKLKGEPIVGAVPKGEVVKMYKDGIRKP